MANCIQCNALFYGYGNICPTCTKRLAIKEQDKPEKKLLTDLHNCTQDEINQACTWYENNYINYSQGKFKTAFFGDIEQSMRYLLSIVETNYNKELEKIDYRLSPLVKCLVIAWQNNLIEKEFIPYLRTRYKATHEYLARVNTDPDKKKKIMNFIEGYDGKRKSL